MARVLIWSPNYAPEMIGIPPLVTDAAEWLAARGHDVSVVTAMPNYPHRNIDPTFRGRLARTGVENGVEVRRSWLRVRPNESFVDRAGYEASFTAFSAPAFAARLRRADVAVCVVPTLLTSASAALLTSATRTPLVLWVQDLVLSAAHAVDGISPAQSKALAAMRRVEAFAARRAARIVSCSVGYGPYLEELGADPDRISTVPNWVDTCRIEPVDRAPGNGRLAVLYTGNVGYTQDFETLVGAVQRVSGLDLRIVGGGNTREHVDRLVSGFGSVEELVPPDEYGALLGSADALVVVQRAIAANANLPSKIASYLAAGRPIVAAIGRETPAAAMLAESGGALVVDPERPDLLAEALVRLRDNPDLRVSLAASGRRYAETHLAKEVVLERLERAFLGVR